jgi:hypothetical protein
MELPLEVAERTSYGSLVMDDAYGGTVTLYGKSYRIGGDSYTVSGFFKHDEEDRYLFNFVFIYEDYGRKTTDGHRPTSSPWTAYSHWPSTPPRQLR